jgi:ParB/RepB/Spo0J family partition protein
MPVARGRRVSNAKTASPPKDKILMSRNGQVMALIGSIKVQRDFNVRKDTDPDTVLFKSIEEHNVLNPIHVRWKDSKEDTLYIIDGERRYRAAKKAKWSEVPVVCRGHLDNRDALVVSLSTNEGQLPLRKMERAEGFRRLRKEGLDALEISNVMGCSERMVTETLRLIDKATPKLRKAVLSNGDIPDRAASRASTLPAEEQEKLTPQLKGLTTKEAVEKVQEVEQRLGVVPKGTRKTGSKKPLKLDKSAIMKRLDSVEPMLEQAHEKEPRSQTIRAQISLCEALRGEHTLESLFRKRTTRNSRIRRKSGRKVSKKNGR